MRTRLALGLSTVAMVASMSSIAYTSVTNSQRVSEIGKISTKSQTTSHAQCLRSRKLAPPLLAHYDSFKGTVHEIPPEIMKLYRETVPKSCPN